MPFKLKKQYRLFGYDYSQNGSYFITIVTKNRICHFGQIINGEMLLTPIGIFVKENLIKFWLHEQGPNPYKTNPYYLAKSETIISIPEFEIMPNHIHLIVNIANKKHRNLVAPTGLQPLAKGSVSAFINHFKGRIKRWCGENNIDGFSWQARFNDRVIRNEDEYNSIARYIRTNIENWGIDEDNV